MIMKLYLLNGTAMFIGKTNQMVMIAITKVLLSNEMTDLQTDYELLWTTY